VNINRKILYGGLIVIAFLFLVISIIRYNNRSLYIQEQELIDYLKDGDIICRLGGKIWSPIFAEISPNDKRFSHIGVVRIRDDFVSVIHVEGVSSDKRGYTKNAPLKEFLQAARTIGIYRVKNIDGYLLSDAAIGYLGLPFDWDFDMEDSAKLYCTELLYVVLKSLDSSIILNTIWLEAVGKYILPIDIVSQSEYFLEIGYWEK
jgi:hypothetical protein